MLLNQKLPLGRPMSAFVSRIRIIRLRDVSGQNIYFGYMSRDMTKPKSDYAPSEDSDQPGHPPSLIRVFNVRSMGS